MKSCSSAKLTRRSALVSMGLVLTNRGMAASVDPRFATLSRPATQVRDLSRVVLQSAAYAGRRLVAVGERGVICLLDAGTRSWRQALSVPCSVTLTGVEFSDESRGWAIGHGGVILITDDGGEHWRAQADGRTLAQLAKQRADLRASDANGPTLAKEAAQLEADGPDKPLLDLVVLDRNRVIVVGAYNLCFETVDGGKSWASAMDRMPNPRGLHLYSIAVHGSTMFAAGEQGIVLRSKDAGRSFERVDSPYAGSWFAIAAASDLEWIIVGLRGHAFRTTDAGQTWTQLKTASPASFLSAAPMADRSILLANQAGQIYQVKRGEGLTQLPAHNLPPVTQAIPLNEGGLLALTFAGPVRLDRAPS